MTSKLAKNTKTLYHISYDFKETIDEFIPRIPVHRCKIEDDTTNRICTSDSLEGCMKGHPFLWYNMVEYPESSYACPYDMMDRMTTLMDYNEEVGHLLKVYQFEVDEDKVVNPQSLLKENLVPDAEETQEHWIKEKISAKRTFYIFIDNAKLENGKKVFSYKVFQENELGTLEDGYYHWDKQNKNNIEELMQEYEMETKGEFLIDIEVKESDMEIPF